MRTYNNGYLDKIDFDYIQNIIKNNYGKKVFCFGGGTAAEILTHEMNKEITIEKFLDNNSSLYGKSINGIEIISPEVLFNEEKGTYIVLILSRHVYEISSQLNNYGLEKNKDYYNIYTQFLPYFNIKKHEVLIEEFQKFIENIPDGELDNRPILHDKKIGIVYICEMYANYTPYSLVMPLLLRYYGYKVSLIIDTLPSFNSYCMFKGVEEIIKDWVVKITNKIKSKSKDIDIMYIEQEGKQKLNFADKRAVLDGVMVTLKWYDAQREYGFLPGDNERENVAENILTNALMYIKSFFNIHKFESINILAGIGNHRAMYSYYAKKLGIRVSTYDNYSSGKMVYSTDGVSAHIEDVNKVIKGEYFNLDEKKKLLQFAKKNFEKRKKATINDGGYNYQITGYKDTIKPYDIIIPLNISYDASALQRERIFSDYIDWLEQTLEFIMENTNASVMIREHPAQNLEIQCIFPDLKKKLSVIKKYGERIFLAVASENINTYQYLEQCKLVLPYTSTVGLEAVISGKNVITHTNVYYNDIGVVFNARNKQEYFDAILYYLEHTKLSDDINIDNAYLAYFYMMNISFESVYYMYNTSWMKMSLNELSQVPEVKWVVAAVGSGIPIIYSSIKSNYLSSDFTD